MAAIHNRPTAEHRIRMAEVRDMAVRIRRRRDEDPSFHVPAGRYIQDVEFLLEIVARYRKQSTSRLAKMPLKGPEREAIIARILELRAQKKTYWEISQEVGAHQETVARHIRAHEKRKS